MESANEALANLNVTSPSVQLQRPSWGMYDAAGDDEENVSSTTAAQQAQGGNSSRGFKNTGIKRFTPNRVTLTPNDNRLAYLASSSAQAEANSSNSSLIAEDERLPLFSFEESLSSLGAVGGQELPEKTKKVNEQQQNVAVPKNIQRNIISR